MFKKNSNIVISLGDDGAIVSCFNAGILNKRIFVTSPLSSDFIDLTKAMPDATIYLLIDTIDQNYIFSSIPNVGRGNVSKIIKRKTSTEFDPNDINAHLFLAKDSSATKKTLKYLFVSVRNGPPFKDWVEVLNSLPNRFEGIYLLPVESEDFIRKVRLAIHGEKKTIPDEWEVLISYNRVGGFRQIVQKNGKLIFTRISQSVSLQTPDAVGRNISQEAANTLEYIRRIGFYDQTISIYIICAKDAASHIEIPGVKPKDVYVCNPFDLAQKLNLTHSSQEGDKFGDVIFAANFINTKKKILRLTTAEIRGAEKLAVISKIFSIFSYGLIAILPLAAAYFMYHGISTTKEISERENQVRSKGEELASVKDFEKEYGIKPETLNDVVKAKSQLSKADESFFDLLQKYKEADTFSSYVKKIAFIPDVSGRRSVTLDAVFDYGNARNYSDMLDLVERYTTKVTEALEKDYKVEFTGLPNEKDIKVDFESNKNQPEDLTISVKIETKR